MFFIYPRKRDFSLGKNPVSPSSPLLLLRVPFYYTFILEFSKAKKTAVGGKILAPEEEEKIYLGKNLIPNVRFRPPVFGPPRRQSAAFGHHR
jgi:hypothetical protein